MSPQDEQVTTDFDIDVPDLTRAIVEVPEPGDEAEPIPQNVEEWLRGLIGIGWFQEPTEKLKIALSSVARTIRRPEAGQRLKWQEAEVYSIGPHPEGGGLWIVGAESDTGWVYDAVYLADLSPR